MVLKFSVKVPLHTSLDPFPLVYTKKSKSKKGNLLHMFLFETGTEVKSLTWSEWVCINKV